MSFKLTDFITVTSTGNVGIGTTSPNRNLSIVSTTDTSVEIKSGTANQSSLWFSDTDDGNIGGVLYTHNDNAMAFRVNDSTKLTISSGGDAGAGQLRLYTDSVERLRINASGNVGIGTVSPGQKLVVGGGTNGRVRIKVDEGTNNFGKFDFSTSDSATSSATMIAEITANITGTTPLTSELSFSTNSGDSLSNKLTISSDGTITLNQLNSSNNDRSSYNIGGGNIANVTG